MGFNARTRLSHAGIRERLLNAEVGLEEEGMLVTEKSPQLNLSNQKRGRLKKERALLTSFDSEEQRA